MNVGQMTLDEVLKPQVDTSDWVHYEIVIAADSILNGYPFFSLPSGLAKDVLGRVRDTHEIYNYDCYLRGHWGHAPNSIGCGKREVYKTGALELAIWVVEITPDSQLKAYIEKKQRLQAAIERQYGK